jgi:hypothetical protein
MAYLGMSVWGNLERGSAGRRQREGVWIYDGVNTRWDGDGGMG